MTPEETHAKRVWGTGSCQVRGCSVRAGYLVRETWDDQSSGAGEWWQYCCLRHAKRFADRHGLEVPDLQDAGREAASRRILA